jgi:hypothetical protein
MFKNSIILLIYHRQKCLHLDYILLKYLTRTYAEERNSRDILLLNSLYVLECQIDISLNTLFDTVTKRNTQKMLCNYDNNATDCDSKIKLNIAYNDTNKSTCMSSGNVSFK